MYTENGLKKNCSDRNGVGALGHPVSTDARRAADTVEPLTPLMFDIPVRCSVYAVYRIFSEGKRQFYNHALKYTHGDVKSIFFTAEHCGVV